MYRASIIAAKFYHQECLLMYRAIGVVEMC